MPFSIFEQMLLTERQRQRMGRGGDFASPLMGEIELQKDCEPLLVTNARGTFVPTPLGRTGNARFGFSYCPIESEGRLFVRFYEHLRTQQGWDLRCKDVPEAVARLQARSLEAKVLVVSSFHAARMVGKEAPMEGFVGVVDGMKVVTTAIPDGCALITVAPSRLGVYTRSGDYLGLLFQRVDQQVVVVDALVG